MNCEIVLQFIFFSKKTLQSKRKKLKGIILRNYFFSNKKMCKFVAC